MAYRLGVASLGVVGLAYVTNPLIAMAVFLMVPGIPIFRSAWMSHKEGACGIIATDEHD